MGNKKIWSYAVDKSQNYIRDGQGRNKLFFVWQALKMKKNNPIDYQHLQFVSTQKDLAKRKRMTPVKLGFFRYIEIGEKESYSGDGESLSHSIAIKVLSELIWINFIIDGSPINMKFLELRIEDLKIQFENGNSYYPDIIGYFDEPKHLLEKWGGKVAIEVKVKHGCEDIKIFDFKNHNIPIIEVTLTEKIQFLKDSRKNEIDENDLEGYYNFLRERFQDKVYAKILSDPEMPIYANNKYLALKKENEALRKDMESINLRSSDFVKEIDNLKKQAENSGLSFKELLEENKRLKNKSLFEKLKELFIHT